MKIEQIEALTKMYSQNRGTLVDRIARMKEEMAQIEQKYLPAIKHDVITVKTLEAELKAAIEASASLFEKPKTRIFHGITVGFRKQKGTVEWSDDSTVIKLIKKHFPEMADVLIKTEEKPQKDALQKLAASDLKKLGIEIKDAGDHVLIKAADGDVDKLVKALLKEKEEEVQEAA